MIGVIGAGAMGAAMTVQLARAGHSVHLLATEFDGAFVDAYRAGENHPSLGVAFPDGLTMVEQDGWDEVLPKAEVLVLAVATAGLVPTVRAIAKQTPGDCVWAVATKGWDEESLMPATGVVATELGRPLDRERDRHRRSDGRRVRVLEPAVRSDRRRALRLRALPHLHIERCRRG
ncbi:MAG: hypothetical protein E6G46_12115 [Actinobacteria bacterium]|nr:MAG: hypothetical protein E6G46_12115 [Actinomycetota bacterium]